MRFREFFAKALELTGSMDSDSEVYVVSKDHEGKRVYSPDVLIQIEEVVEPEGVKRVVLISGPLDWTDRAANEEEL